MLACAAVRAPRAPLRLTAALFVTLILAAAGPARAQLSGTYTIGAGGDYATFTAAVSAVVAQGVSGPVTFDVLNGVYTEQIVIPLIPGASATNRVTFRSQSGNPADVTLQVLAGTSTESVVTLAGTSGVTISAMTLQYVSGPAGPAVLQFIGPGSDNQLVGCVLPDNGVYATQVAFSGDHARVEVRGNTLDSGGGISLGAGQYDQVKVLANRINNSTLYAFFWTGPATGSLLVANNFMSNSGMEFWAGPGTGGVEIAYNSVSSNSFGLAIFASGSGATPGSFTIVNNILSTVTGGVYAYFVDDGSVVATSDHNDLYAAPGTLLSAWNGSILPTLAGLQAVSSKDMNSVNVDPGFVSATDLHTSQPGLNGQGIPFGSVWTDIDGEVRDPGTPDIGADEFTPGAPIAAGTYTIGAGGQYSTFGVAVADLEARGVAGAVTFSVLPGIYPERVVLTDITGATPTSAVTFASSADDPASVVLQWAPPGDGESTLELNGASWITFRKLTIVGTADLTPASAVVVNGETEGILLSGCVLSITGGASGPVVSLPAGSSHTGLEISDCAIGPASYGVLGLEGGLADCRVLRNRFTTTVGMHLEEWAGASGALLVANNFFSNSQVLFYPGSSSGGLDFIFNTVTQSDAGNAFAMAGSGIPASMTVLNNVIASSGDFYAYLVSDPGVIANSDFNDLSATGSATLAHWGGAPYTTLGALQAASGKDAHSISVIPTFTSATDLHTATPQLNGAGTPAAGITTDIDGDVRDATSPDIGADEFGLPTGLAGTYTIGAGQDYADFVEAISDLQTLGVSGPVTFDVLPGTYTQRPALAGPISGSSATNRVTFRSQTGNAADVTVQWATSGVNVGVVHLEDVDHVTFDRLTVRQLGTDGGSAVRLAGTTNGVHISRCELTGTGQGGYGVHVSSGSTADSLLVSGSNVTGFMTGVFVEGGALTGARILGNTISNAPNQGIYLAGWTGPATGSVLVANNFLVSSAMALFQVAGSQGAEVYHNSVSVSGGSSALTVGGTAPPAGSVRIKNNILSGTSASPAMQVVTGSAIAESDYNVLYSTSPSVALWNGTGYATLAALQAASGKDVHSVSFNPGFTSPTDLHTQLSALADLGTPIAAVTTDIDGEPRSATAPDIGADEYTSSLAPLAGTFTVGAGGTYATPGEAIADIYRHGVSGPVDLAIADGTYTGQLVIGAFAGAAPASRLTLRSQSGNAAGVQLQYATSSTAQGVVELAHADHVTLSQLTLQVTQASGLGTGFKLVGNSRGAKLLLCSILGLQSNGWGVSIPATVVAESLEVRGNTIPQASRGLYAVSSVLTGVRITHNRFGNASQGIYLEGPSGPATGSVFIANNFLTLASMNINQGSGLAGVEVLHNSINMTNSADALILQSPGTPPPASVRVLNNILASGTGHGYYVQHGTAIAQSDFNDIFSSGAYVAVWNGIVRATLADFQAAGGTDANSLSTPPGFLSANDLHTTLAALDGRGTPLASVPDDIDGDPRDPGTPDIGADEFTANPALAGDYTIGAGGSYTTIVAAMADLVSKGVTAPVTFDLLPGTYAGQVVIATIPGASPVNTVMLRSQSGNAADVTLQFATASVNQGVVELVGASHVTLTDLTIQVTQAAGNGVGVRLTGTSVGARILDCVFTGLSVNGYGIHAAGAACQDLEVRGNTIAQSSYGVTLSNSALTNVRILGNTIGSAGLYGITVNGWTGPATGSVRVANNVLQDARLNLAQSGQSRGAEVFHNTISYSGTAPALVLSVSGGTPTNAIQVVNNVVACSGGGTAYSVSTPASVAQSDHNAFFTTGPTLATWSGASHVSLASLRAASGKDLASIEAYPGFLDATLHTRLAMLDGAGAPLAAVTEDFDGEPRSATTPDIGADEFANPFTPLAGAYTVGTGGDYTSLSAVAIDLLNRGVSGPVTFNLLSQTFSEPLSLYTPAGVSPANRLTFRSQSGNAADVTLAYNPGPTASGVVQLAGTDYITISDLTVQITHATGLGYGVQFLGGSIGAHVLRCVIGGLQTTGYGFYWPSGSRSDSVEVRGNTVGQSNRGVFSQSTTMSGVRIVGNAIRDAVSYGIAIDGWVGPSSGAFVVANNMLANSVLRLSQSTSSLGGDIFNNTVVMTSAAEALSLPGTGVPANSLRIRNNVFACPGGGRAILVSTPSAISVSDNNCLYSTGGTLTLFGSTASATLADHRAANAKDLNSVSFHPGVVSATDLHTTLAALDGRGVALASVTDDLDGEPRDPGTPDIGADEFAPGTPLAGDYTVGTGGTYPTFAAANADLLRKGVSAPVSFRVLNGTYTERLLLETPGGASPASRVDFRSNSGNGADVTLQFATSAVTQGVVEFLGADWMTVFNMTIRVTHATGQGSGVRVTGATTGALVSLCRFTGLQTIGYGVSAPSGAADSLEIWGCYIDSGARGISLESVALEGVKITKCGVVNTTGVGLYVSGWTGPASGAVLLANNSFTSPVQFRTTSVNSIGAELYHNSVSITVGTNDPLSLTIASGTGPANAMRLKNNVFAAFTGGKALNLSGASMLAESDYNDLFASGTTLVSAGSGPGTQFGTLGEWQATGRDPNSINIHPGFLSVSNDLHTTSSFLDGRGTPIAAVPDDIDGQPRSATAPDIGSDEFDPLAPLAGAFTVGSGGTYATPTDAISDLYRRGVSAPVSLELLPGTYSGQWFLQTPAGASPSNRVTVRSQSGNPADVTLQATLAGNSQGVVELRGADYVTISALTLQPSTNGSGVLVNGRSTGSQVVGCRITGLGTTGGIGIHLLNGVTVAESLEVRGNTVPAGVACFYVNGGVGLTGVRVVKNTFNSTGTSAGPLAISGWSGPATGAVLVANNFITGNGRVVFNQDPTSLGGEFYFNSVSMTSSQAALYLGVNTGTPPVGSLRIKNNVLANSGTGSAYQVFNAASAAAVAESDYNDLYKSAAGTLANWAGTNYASLAALQAASGKDVHSVSDNPLFASATDLHTTAGVLAGAGAPIATVPDDIDGQVRDAVAPDIGADEYIAALPPLAGAYTVGAGGDYATFAAANTDLATRGVSAAVTFDVLPGTYTEQVTLNPIGGSSPANRVTFRSQTGNAADVTLQFANSAVSSGVLQLPGTDHVTFADMTIRMSGAASNQGAAVYATGALTGVRFTGCTISAASSSGRGMLATAATLDSLELRGNRVTLAGEALFLNNCALTGVQIVANRFEGVSITTTGGVLVNAWSGPPTGALRIANNFFMGNARPDITQGTASNGLEVYDNSVRTSSAVDAFTLAASSTPPAGSARIVGNIFYCSGTGRALNVGVASAIAESDYNNLYKAGAGTLIAWNGSGYATLAALQSASGKDLHSVSGDPLYSSATDLHTNAALLAGAGTPLATVPDDIDGDLRHPTAPDIGADETPALVPLAGTYTVGPTGDYSSIGAALTALGTNGISAPVSFLIQSGTYDGTTTINPIVGASSVNRVRFVAQSGNPADVVLQSPASSSNGSDAVLRLVGARYVDVDSITLTATAGGGGGSLVWFTTAADNNRFMGCTLNFVTASRYGLNGVGVSLDSLVVRDCTFSMPGGNSYGVAASGASTGNGAIIENNTFTLGATGAGVYWTPSVPTTGMVIRDNTVTVGGNGTGIRLDNAMGAEVTKNRISSGGFGMDLQATGGSTLVANNFVQAFTTGIFLQSPVSVRLYHNSVNQTGAMGDAVRVSPSTLGALTLANNILACPGGGTPLAVNGVPGYVASSDYNDLYTTGATVARYDVNSYATLADVRAATGFELNELSVPPVFTSSTDLHSNSPGLDNAGTPLAVVTDDIDGEPRSLATPDIGADEFSASDGMAPVVVMIGGPSPGGSVSTPTVTFTWSALDNVSLPSAIVSTWTLDGGTPVTLPAGATSVSFDSLAAGAHTFSVTATDEASLTSAPVAVPFTYVIPAPSATTPTAGPITWSWPAVPAAAQSWQLEIATAANPDSVVFTETIRRTSYAWSSFFQMPWQSPENSGVTYVARVSPSVEPYPATFGAPSAFSTAALLDRDPPSLSIVSGPAEGQSYAGSSANFVVSGSDAGVGGVQFSWRLDRGPWAAWQSSSGFTVNGLTPGAHAVQVRAKDSLGNTRTLDCTFDVQGLANLWTADDGTPGFDRVGSSDGAAVGGLVTHPTAGHTGNGLDFNGTDALLEIPDSPALYPGAGSFSVGVWARFQASDVSFGQRMLSRREAGGAAGGTAQAGYELGSNNGDVYFTVMTPNGFTGFASIPQAVTDGQWHHYVGVWNRERRYIAIYQDGMGVGLQYMDGEDPFGTQPLSPIQDEDGGPDPLMLGGNQAAGSTAGENFFTGQLDDAMYVARALDGGQVQRLFLGGALAGCAPIRRNFGTDLIAPVVVFEAGPADGALLVGDTTSYAWSATDNETPPASITYRSVLDGAFSGAYTAADSRALTNLADGVRTFRVEARDLAGNVSAPIARTLRVHRTPPDIAFDSPAAGAFTGANVTVAWHLSARSAMSNPDSIFFEARVDSGAFSAPSRDSSLALTGLPEGAHTVDVRVTDNAGLTTTRTRAFTVDLTPPTVAFTGGPAESGYSVPAVNFTFVGTDNLTPVNQLRYSRKLDAGSFTPPSTTTSAFFGDLGPGPHTFTVRSHDAADNVSAEVVRQWTVDITPPETQIAGGPANGSTLNTNSATFDFTGTDNLTPVGSIRFESRLDAAGFSAPTTATSRTFIGMLDGPHTFEVRAVDLAGLVDGTPATRSFTVDAQGPAITIASGPANNACVATTDVSFNWSATDAVTPPAQIEFSYQFDTAPFTAFGPGTDASFTSLAEGLHTFTLQARDGSGNVTSVARTFRVDVSAPVAAAPTTHVLDSQKIRIQCTATDNSGTTGFRVQVSTDPAFGSVAADVQIGASGTYDYIGVPGNSYYARSQAGDCAGNLSAFTGPSNVAVLANLPNLVVTNVTAPPAAISGQAIVVDYTVSNTGAGPTSTPSWTESVYLSPTPAWNAGTAVLLGQRQNVTFLGVGESYTGSVTGTIPLGTSGPRYVLVTADAGNVVPETDGTDNTTASSTVAVTLGEVADLVVTQVVSPPTALSSDTITVSWTVRNDGTGRTDASQWYDAVFLSTDPTFDFDVLGGGNIRATDDWLGRRQHTGVLEADSTYTASLQVVLPPYFGGTRYLIVASDMNAATDNQAVGERGLVFEDVHETNATAAEAIEVTQQLPPDLTVDALTTVGAPVSGSGLQVTFTIGNHGFDATGSGAWTDQLYLSADAVLDGSDVLLGSYPSSGSVELDATYSRTTNVVIPKGTSGPRWLIVKVDTYAQLFEYLESNNVVAIAQPITVALSPWANLSPTGVSVSDTVVAGGTGTAQWQVANPGTAAATTTWTDNIDLAATPAWTPSARVSGTKRAYHALQAGDAYTASTTFDVPTSYSGTYYVFARTDGLNEVFEHTDEGDNVMLVGSVYVKPYPAIDLAVSEITAPPAVGGGQSLPVTFTVTNQGAGTTLAGWWAEEVWLSTDPVFSAGTDVRIAYPGHSGSLAPGGSYTRVVNGSVPEGLNGIYHVLVRTDPAGSSGDGSLSNNTVASAGTVVVTSAPPPQLTVSSVTVGASLDAGQPALVGWQLNNAGAGPVPNAEWYVGVYLSQDPWLDGSDVSLGSVAGPAGLAGATSVPQQLVASMPVWASGAYYVLVRSDNRNEVWESGAENDNTATAPTVLTLPPPSDLVVTDVVVPGAAVPGEPIQVSYTLANQGTNPAVGQLQNAVYMSADVAFVSDDDPLVGVEVVNVNLPPGTSQRFTHRLSARPLQVDLQGNVTGLLPALSPGAYHAIVKANIRDNIRELDGGNNQTVSAAQVQTDLPSLVLNVPAPFALANAQAKFYKVTVPADFDLRLTLASGVVDATNEMFVAFGRTPDENEYDFASPAEFSANPVVLVPQTQAGTYYIMVVARSLGPVASLENLTLLAETLPFSLTSHTPEAGGAGGRVTVRVRGAGLRDTTELRLEQAGIVKARAKLAKFTNSTDLLARFDLTGVAEGLYDLVAANGLTTVVVPGGFAVEPARPVEVAIETDNADVLRRTATAPFTVRLRNPSNQDAPVVTARILFPAASQLKSLETSPGLHSMSQLAPMAGSSAVIHRAGGTDSLEAVEVVAANLAPGEVRSMTLGLAGFESSPYSLRVLADAMTLRTFLDRQQSAFEAARRALLADPTGLPAPLLLLANDAWAFRDSALWKTYVVPGVLAANEVDDYLFEIDHLVLPSPVYPGLPGGPQSLLDELASGGPCTTPGAIPECAPDVAVPGSGLPACASVFDALDLPVPLGLEGGVVARVAGSTAAGFTATASANARVVVPCDPNLITGPAGFGTEKWVRASLPMQYRVDFENLPGVASAPAQVVRIVVPIDPNLDPTTFRVGGMGFGGTHQINVPAGRTSYSTQNGYADLGLAVRVTVGINLTTREASWVFTTIDPATGQQPTNPYVGFLPVNDQIGSGTGFATYSIQPYANAALGSTVQAQASITFDANNPVPTNLAANRVDPRAPASAALTSIEVLDATRVRVHWTTNGDSTGAGLANVTLYARQDTGPFTPVAPPVTGSSLEVPVANGHTFGFFTLAADNVGNAEAAKANPEAAVTLGTPQLGVDEQLPRVTLLHPNFPNPFRGATSVRFDLARAEAVTLDVYDVQGRLVSKLLDGKRLEAGTHTIEISRLPRGAGVYFYRFRAGQYEKTRRMVLIP